MLLKHLFTLSATFLGLLAAGSLICPALAQMKGPEKPNFSPEQPVNTKAAPSLRVDVELALANVTVTDPYNRTVTGLEKENFRVFEDGVEQAVTQFSIEDVPTSIGLVIDMSGSMTDKVDKARQAAVAFFRTANFRDEFFVVGFNDQAEVISPFTSSVEEIQNRMLFTAAKGRTDLLDGICLGLSRIKQAR